MKTPLYQNHLALGAKFITFANWEMPLQYEGVLAEYQAVRKKVGLFDVSHMGCVKVKGLDAEKFLDFVSTNHISGKKVGSAIYTVWCHSHGGSVDDVIVFKKGDNEFFIIVNASNRDKDVVHLGTVAQLNEFDVEIQEKFSNTGILSLQGPLSYPLLSSIIPEVTELKPMHFITLKKDLVVSRSGYTGEIGFELIGSSEDIIEWWNLLLDKGKKYEIQPAGLGARDILRIEKGYALYGNELTDSIAPNESVAAWTVKWDKLNFLGKEALEKIEQNSFKRSAYGVCLVEKGIPRQKCQVFKGEIQIGEVTSGSFSPSLNKGIALILVNSPLNIGERVAIKIRQAYCQAEIIKLPFL